MAVPNCRCSLSDKSVRLRTLPRQNFCRPRPASGYHAVTAQFPKHSSPNSFRRSPEPIAPAVMQFGQRNNVMLTIVRTPKPEAVPA